MKIKDHVENALLFPRLWKVVRLILTIAHSNAEEERVFSITRKNKTSFWPRLDPEMTLASVVIVILAMEFGSVETFNIPPEFLTATKSTTYNIRI